MISTREIIIGRDKASVGCTSSRSSIQCIFMTKLEVMQSLISLVFVYPLLLFEALTFR
jgi:hypothetical protein